MQSQSTDHRIHRP